MKKIIMILIMLISAPVFSDKLAVGYYKKVFKDDYYFIYTYTASSGATATSHCNTRLTNYIYAMTGQVRLEYCDLSAPPYVGAPSDAENLPY